MTEEETIDCIMEVDKILSDLESALESKNYKLVKEKLNEARSAIDDLRTDDCSDDAQEIEMKMMKKLK